MRFLVACKRHYTNKDLLLDRFGRLYHLPVELARSGHEGLVVAADYRNHQRLTLSEPGLTFESVPLSGWRLPAFTWQLWRRAKRFRPDVVFASADTHFGVMAALIARRMKIPFVFDMYDNYEVFASARIPGMRWALRRVLRSADLVICAGERLRALTEGQSRASLVIANGVDTTLFAPGDRPAARRELGLPETATTIGYFGSIARGRGIEVLISAVSEIRKGGRPVTLLMAGTNEIDLPLTEDWIDWRGPVGQAQVPNLINASDVVVIPYLSNPQVDVSNASKLPEYLACGAAIVTTRVSDYAEAFDLPDRIVCRPGDAPDMARAIIGQLDDPITPPLPPGLTWSSLGHRLSGALDSL